MQMDLETGLPQNIDAEKTILGAILLDVNSHFEASQHLKAEDFSLDAHRRIYRRMAELIQANQPVDLVTLTNALSRNKEVEHVGGVAYLAGLTEGLPRRPVIEEYARIVKDKSLARKVMSICSQAIARAGDQSEPAFNTLGDLMQRLNDIEYESMEGSDLESVGQWLSQNDIFEERIPGIPTGIDEYDKLTNGMHKGELTVFAGRTSMGKTSHCGTITWQMAKRGHQVAVFINEQRKASFIGRMLCGRSGVSFENYRCNRLDMIEKVYVQDAREEFMKLPIFIDQRPSMSVASIRAKAARLKRTGELDVILIDQLNRVSNEGFWEKGKRGDEVIGDKVAALQSMAQALDVPVGLYHQLNRETAKNDEGRPNLTNLKNSGAIEEHADNIALFHRPAYYKRDEERKNEAEIILAKQRDGETGIAHCEFHGSNCSWRNKRRGA